MKKQTINQLCEQLTKLADNFAENERIIHGLIATLEKSGHDITKEDLEQEPVEDSIEEIKRMLHEIQSEKIRSEKTKNDFSRKFNEIPGPSDWPFGVPITCNVSHIVPCSDTQTVSSVYAGVPETTVKTLNGVK